MPGDGKLRPMALLAFFVPLAAGAGAGALVNLVIADALRDVPAQERTLVNRFWYGARIQWADAPGEALVNVVAVGAAVAVWMVMARFLKRGRTFAAALVEEAAAFVPSLSMLILCALENYGLFPLATAFGVHAVVFSLAGFVAVNAFLFASRRAAPAEAEPSRGRGAVAAVTAAAFVYWITFSLMGALQYYSLRISYTDTADWEQMLWNTMRGRFLMSSAFPHMFFGEHVQAVHLALLPVYALFPSLVTLMVVKSAVLASGAFPVYLLAARKLGSRWLAAGLGAAYLAYPAMQYADLEIAPNTFRPEVFAIPLLLWAVYFLEVERFGWLTLMSALAVSCKEEIALPVAMIGIVLLFKRRWAWGAGFAVVAIAWFAACVGWIIPHYRGSPSHIMKYYLDFGENATLSGMLLAMASQPLHTLEVMFRPAKIDYLLMLLVPLGLRPPWSPRMLFIMLPSLATTLLASRLPSFNIYWHYQIAVVPCMVAAAVYGAENCAGFLAGLRFVAPNVEAGARKRSLLIALTLLVLTSSVLGNVLYAKSPISLLFYNAKMQTHWRALYVPGERAKVFFAEVRPLVPAEVSVSATEFLATYFAARKDDFVFPDGLGAVEYVVVDTRDPWLEDRLREKGLTRENALNAGGYDRIYETDGFIVYRKKAAADAPAGAGTKDT